MICKNCHCELGLYNLARIVLGNNTHCFCSNVCLEEWLDIADEFRKVCFANGRSDEFVGLDDLVSEGYIDVIFG